MCFVGKPAAAVKQDRLNASGSKHPENVTSQPPVQPAKRRQAKTSSRTTPVPQESKHSKQAACAEKPKLGAREQQAASRQPLTAQLSGSAGTGRTAITAKRMADAAERSLQQPHKKKRKNGQIEPSAVTQHVQAGSKTSAPNVCQTDVLSSALSCCPLMSLSALTRKVIAAAASAEVFMECSQ